MHRLADSAPEVRQAPPTQKIIWLKYCFDNGGGCEQAETEQLPLKKTIDLSNFPMIFGANTAM